MKSTITESCSGFGPGIQKEKLLYTGLPILISAEHFKVENDVIFVTKTKPGSVLGRAAVGGLLFGGVGAIVGGASDG